MRRWNKFVKGAGMLAILGIIGKAIGVFYRLPLTNVLGAEGMGLYQMVFPLYSLILALCCGGLPAGLSKCIGELTASNRYGDAKRALGCAIVTLISVALLAATAVFLLGNGIASLQGNAKAGIAYAAIAPAIVFSGLVACIRGYFQGLQNLLPSGVSQLIEQAAKVLIGLVLAAALVHMGVEYGVLGALIGVSVSELLALIYLAVSYAIKSKRPIADLSTEAAADVALERTTDKPPFGGVERREKAGYKEIFRRIYSVALPVTLGSLVIPLSQVLDSFLVINILVRSGEQTEAATSLFGLFNGPVGSLVNMPSVITAALSAALLPKVAFSLGKGESAGETVNKSMSVFAAVILPCAMVFALTPYPVLGLLYSRGLSDAELSVAAALLRIESINVIFVGLIQLTSAMLQGAGRAGLPVINLVIGVSVKVAATLLLLPVIGIYGAAVSNMLCYGVTCSLDLFCAKRRFGMKAEYKRIAKIFLCVAVFSVVLLSYGAFSLIMNGIIAFICAFALASAAYLLLLIKTKCILLNEILS